MPIEQLGSAGASTRPGTHARIAQDHGTPPPVTLDEVAADPAMTTILLTEADSGRSIAARVGDEIVVELPENPTTGYRWEVVTADGLEPVADGYLAAEPDPADAEPAFGRGSLRELRFRVREPGVARLEAEALASVGGRRLGRPPVRRRDRRVRRHRRRLTRPGQAPT